MVNLENVQLLEMFKKYLLNIQNVPSLIDKCYNFFITNFVGRKILDILLLIQNSYIFKLNVRKTI